MHYSLQQRFCPHCGAQRAPEWAFCAYCSKPLPALDASSGRGAEPATEAPASAEQWRAVETALRRGEIEEAQRLAQALLDEQPESAAVLALMGTVLLRRYQVQQAQGFLERAVALAPESPYVRLRMAEYWLALGVTQRAQEELEVARKAAADDPRLHQELTAVAERLKEKTRGNFIWEVSPRKRSGPERTR